MDPGLASAFDPAEGLLRTRASVGMDEAQARFWEAVATRCAGSPAVFCFDLMNEPVVPGGRREPGEVRLEVEHRRAVDGVEPAHPHGRPVDPQQLAARHPEPNSRP